MNLDLVVVTATPSLVHENLPSLLLSASRLYRPVVFCDGVPVPAEPNPAWDWQGGDEKRGPVWCLEASRRYWKAPVIAYAHDDLIVRERGWDERVLAQFEDPEVGVVGFGGGTGLGADDLYRVPYEQSNLARIGYASNAEDAERHGARRTDAWDAASIDGFFVAIRAELLERAGGWPTRHLVHHCYDTWVCCVAHELGYKVRCVGVKCLHLGGRTSIQKPYQDWCVERLGKTDLDVHRDGHRWLYERFRDVLPWRV